MNKDSILILPPLMTDDSIAIWKVSIQLGWKVQRVNNWRISETLSKANKSITIYREPLFAEAIADQLGIILLEPSIDWLTTLPLDYVSREITFTTLDEARTIENEIFVKPADGKIFEPKVYESGKDLPTEKHVDGNTPVLTSTPILLKTEIRLFINNNSIVTSSPYWRNDDLAQDQNGDWPYLGSEKEESHSFANQLLTDTRVETPPAFVLDVGLTNDNKWVVIEANPCWGSGLYGCDPLQVIKTASNAMVIRDKLREENHKWVSKRKTLSA